jgi:hypothetical protein
MRINHTVIRYGQSNRHGLHSAERLVRLDLLETNWFVRRFIPEPGLAWSARLAVYKIALPHLVLQQSQKTSTSWLTV